MFRTWFRKVSQDRMARAARRREVRLTLDSLEDRTLPSGGIINDVFFIDMENHNLTQPSGTSGPQQLLGNPAAPYLNSLMTAGNPNALQTSFASNYYNVEFNNPSVSIHPSEPNYVWQEAGVPGTLNDADPYANTPNNIVNAPNLSALLQGAGIPWKSYQEDIDLATTAGANGNVPGNITGATPLTSTVAPQDQWTVPLKRFSGTSADYTNPYNGSHQYDFAPKHDGTLFFTATNGGNDFSPSNPEAGHYAPLQQLQTDLDNNTVARYSLITPDQFDDMHSSLNTDFTYNGMTFMHNTDQEAIATGDNFLSIIVPQIMASHAYKNKGVIVIWYDETEAGNTTSFTIPEIIISPLAKGNAYNSTLTYTHSSDLKSMEELFGVSAPGGGFLGDANTPGTNDLSDFFSPPVALQKPPAFAGGLHDAGNLQNGNAAVAGLTVPLGGINTATIGVNQQAVNLTATGSDVSNSFVGVLPGVKIGATPQNVGHEILTPAGAGDDLAVGVDQAIDSLDFAHLTAGQNHR
jgi:hypothetical protein